MRERYRNDVAGNAVTREELQQRQPEDQAGKAKRGQEQLLQQLPAKEFVSDERNGRRSAQCRRDNACAKRNDRDGDVSTRGASALRTLRRGGANRR